jgi:hypothetical protein
MIRIVLTPFRARAAALLALVALGAGCKAKIGDKCTTALDCSALGDRLCDVTQPDGYCTLFNCQPDTCPKESACIVFRSQLDPACGNTTDARAGRFASTFCMRTCSDEGDCRPGYECVAPQDRAARLVDKGTEDPESLKICLAVSAPPQVPVGGTPGVCSPGTAPPLVPYKPPPTNASSGTGAGGMGQGGAGGQGGKGGATSAGGAGGK